MLTSTSTIATAGTAQNVSGTYSITWGDSQPLGYGGDRPDVAVTKEGYILLAYTKYAYSGYGSEAQMRYWVGILNPAGDTRQTITWRVKDNFFDTGKNASLAFNSNAVLVEAHEGIHTDNLYYRVGHFADPDRGDLTLIWEAGSRGVKYDRGIDPAISVNENDQIVECHRRKTPPRFSLSPGDYR